MSRKNIKLPGLKALPTAGMAQLSTLRKMWVGTGGRDLDDATQDPNRGLDDDLLHVRTPTARTFYDLTAVKRVRDHFTRLPEPGETMHAIVSGKYPLWAIIPATLELAAGATIDELALVTLSFSRDNADELLSAIDAGTVKAATLVVSHYFAATNKYIYDPIAKAVTGRGQRILACRTHAKIINARLSDGRCFTVESSANLRSCKNIEQMTWTQDADLYQFHRRWIDSLFEKGEQ